MYHDFLKNSRLAVLTGRVLGAKDRPTTPQEAHALGRSILCTMPPEQALEAQCLAAEIGELLDAQRDRYATTRHKLSFTSLTYHVESDVATVAALLCGFWDRNADSDLAPDFRDFAEVGVGSSGLGVVAVPAAWDWTGRTFVYD
mgnify:FL=1